MKRKTDARVIRSQSWIKESFLQLLESHDYEFIAVQDIMNEAQMNRVTFYRHFEGKDHLLQTIVNELFDLCEYNLESCEEHYDFVTVKLPHPRFIRLLEFIKSQERVFFIFLIKQELPLFQKRFHQLIEQSTRSTLSVALKFNHSVKFPRGITETFIASSITGSIMWWIEQDHSCSAYELASYITEMIDYGIYS
ncbi:TetR/AcrR family transcriptional regulator [Halobacillus seohaensis]|uniref:TetR/AcrR family transcriptional regulator n=1 Tax=Halobacillus seohaensis TaxID=447421 RepID=A0ABW2EPY9_9BACI